MALQVSRFCTLFCWHIFCVSAMGADREFDTNLNVEEVTDGGDDQGGRARGIRCFYTGAREEPGRQEARGEAQRAISHVRPAARGR